MVLIMPEILISIRDFDKSKNVNHISVEDVVENNKFWKDMLTMLLRIMNVRNVNKNNEC